MGIFSDMMSKITSEEEKVVKEETVVQDSAPKTVAKNLDKLAIATAALSIYTAACDGRITLDEFFEVELGIGAVNSKAKISDAANEEIKKITANHNITWDEVTSYLDNVRADDLEAMKSVLVEIVRSSNGIEESEKKVLADFDAYIESRR